ncbi:MAG TPA: transcriptional regulator [Candidatus Avidesulfovibrio excrementigallinarum]|nr:transcriptional regulator [Candidatus Avidesulfovibrio excrementigallinarum]
MWKWLLIALVVYGVYRMFMNDRKKNADDEKKRTEQRVIDGELVKDPECGAYVDADSNITVRNGETVYHFCSYDCRDKFLARVKALNDADGQKTEAEKDS